MPTLHLLHGLKPGVSRNETAGRGLAFTRLRHYARFPVPYISTKRIAMPLRIYNTLTSAKEEFVPLQPGKVSMYVCGVTVYDNCHIGHARANVAFDVVYRYLCHSGYAVTYVRNYTDIDDKIINRAKQEGVEFNVISERYIQAFDDDMARLNLAMPTHQPKATEYVDEIIALVGKLVAQGTAYPIDGDVYFSVGKFPSYLKLSGRNLEEMQAGARVDVDERKRHPMDFALWKGAKPGEPYWPSPWGNGRPGWHIECSAMSMKLLGETFDIHGGGKDLVFPHHENEIAQSEAASGKQFVRYWMHNGFVNINAEKMSKSLGNFFTIRDILERYDSEVLRFFLLSAHYRSPIDFSDQNLADADAGLSRIYSALAAMDDALADSAASREASPALLSEAALELQEKLATLHDRFCEAMDDDFNTALAIANIFDLVRVLNRVLADKAALNAAVLSLFSQAKTGIARIAGVLGVMDSVPSDYQARLKSRKSSDLNIDVAEIERIVAERTAARKVKDFRRSDELRDQLLAKGVELLDGPSGTAWKIK
ncbi:MAG: cysS [Deltaproteobacteria bacterium]|nr:cysS [Deltaproteobacteria bacterium]